MDKDKPKSAEIMLFFRQLRTIRVCLKRKEKNMIKANIYNKKLVVENFAVSDSVMFDTVHFTFPDEWNGYVKTAVFKTESGETVNVVLDGANPLCISENECYIPFEVIKSPYFYLSVFGVSGESVATTTQVKVNVLQSGYSEGEEPLEPTPTEYQQIINISAETKEIAQSVRDDADNGAFKGDKGDKGDTGPQGEKGDKGDKGDPGKDGVITNLDQTYNPKSENAQSGLAVEEAISNKANLEAIVIFEPPTIESVIAMSGYEFHRGKFYYNGKYEENGILFDCFIDEKQAQPLYLKFTTEISELFKGCLVEIEFDENEQFNPVILNFTIFKDLSDKADICEVKSLAKNLSSAIENALIKNTVSGSVVKANDVSPFEHNLDVKLKSVRNKNLIPFPYTNTSKTISGVTFTVNDDGTITVNGTATDYIRYDFQITSVEEDKEYTLSGCPEGGGDATYFLGLDTYQKTEGTPNTFIGTEIPEIRLCIGITNKAVCDNLIFKPQLEYGSVATEYEGYISDFSNVSVSRFGKNLFNQASTEVGTITVGFSNTTPRNLEHGKWYTNLTLSGYYDSDRAVTVSLNGDNVTVKANATDESTRLYGLSKAFKCKPNTTYTLSYKMNNGVNRASGIGFYNADKIHTSFVYCDSGNSFTTPDNCYWILVCFHGNSEATEVTYSDIQLELGNKATVYEPYTEPQTAIANADGTVECIISVSPNMTLFTNTDGVEMNITYNADTKMYIDNKIALLSLAVSNN